MTRAFLSLVVLAGIASQALAVEQDHYVCKTTDGQTQIKIDTANRPDIDLGAFDSAAPDATVSDGVNVEIVVDAKPITGSVKFTEAAAPSSQQDIFQTQHGAKCRIGVFEDGIGAKAIVTNAGQQSSVSLNCSDIMLVPDGAITCE